jgi:hypothetical protein
MVPGADSLIVVGLLGACELACDVRSGCEVALELPVLAHATPVIAITAESARTFAIAFIWDHLLREPMVQRLYRQLSHQFCETGIE